ncbi:hypothetical protein IAU60_000703 [Kwoniella sp. DSM 27419]
MSGHVLADQAVLFAEKQFAKPILDLLTEKVKALGGKVVAQREEATILIVNPVHPQHAKEKENIGYLSKNYPAVAQPEVFPYHWLSNCLQTGRLLKLEELTFVSPIFTYPAQLEDWRPLKCWVSVNVNREEGESPESARDVVVAKLEAGGALNVAKRSQADVLVVDENSQFAKKVHVEKKNNNRNWQRIVERDWVDGCWNNKKITWRMSEAQEQEGEDSMAGDDTPYEKGKGPGRPTGKPRIEYTSEDDDFMCRWLAVYHPTGSWSSRKTYHGLVDMKEQYPIADRHSPQSWHERFKKSAAILERRVKRFISQGIDDTLKTADERQKVKELVRARNAAEANGDAQPVAAGVAPPILATEDQDGQANVEPGPSSTAPAATDKLQRPIANGTETTTADVNPAPTAAVQDSTLEGAAESAMEIVASTTVETSVVEVISAEVPSQPVQAGEAEPAAAVDSVSSVNVASEEITPSNGQGAPAPIPTDNVAPAEQSPTEQPVAQETTEIEIEVQPSESAEESFNDLLPSATQLDRDVPVLETPAVVPTSPAAVAPDPETPVVVETVQAKSTVIEVERLGNKTTDSELIERDLLDIQMEIEVDVDEAAAGEDVVESAQSEAQPEAQTEAQADPEPSQAQTDMDVDTELEESVVGEGTQAIMDDFRRARAAASGATASNGHTDAKEAREEDGALAMAEEAVSVAPNAEVPASSLRPAVPAQPNVTLEPSVAVSQKQAEVSEDAPSVAPAQPVEQSLPIPSATQATPTPAQPRARETYTPSSPIMPTPGQRVTPSGASASATKRGRMSLLQEQLQSSAGKRRRTLDRASAAAARRANTSIETVYADVSIPPRPVSQTSQASSPAPSVVRSREPSPPLTPIQRAESVTRGRSIALNHAREYKARIAALSKEHGIAPSEVVKVMSELAARRKSIGGSSSGRSGYWDEIGRAMRERYRR